MTTTLAAPPDLSVARRDPSEIEVRGTRRGKTHLSLGELETKVEHYPVKARDATRAVQAFFVQHCGSDIERLRGLAQEKFNVRRSPEYFSNWVKGYYFRTGGGVVGDQGLTEWLNFCELLAEHDRVTSATGKLGFIETGTTRAIENHIREILDESNPCRIAGVAGPTGSQKTASLTLLALKLGWPRAVRVECNSRMSLPAFQRKIANVYNCRVGRSGSALEENIAEQLRKDRLVIVHNIQRAFLKGRDVQPVFEWLIEMQEEKQFPLVLEFKRDFHDATLSKGEAAGYFEQVIGRMGGLSDILVLPEFTPAGDLRAIARAFNLHDGDGAMDYLKRWSKQPGRIRVVFRRLHRARQFARADKSERITLDLLKEVDNYIPPYVSGDEADEEGAS